MTAGKGKYIMAIMLSAVMAFGLFGCGVSEPKNSGPDEPEEGPLVKAAAEGIREFYYTYENINFNALFIRYRIYVEDGIPYLYYEKRERPDDYGPCSEKDITEQAEAELTEEQWQEFLGFIEAGTIRAREDDLNDGDSGPWMFIYRDGGPEDGEEFHFESYGAQFEFAEFCESVTGCEN